MPSLKEQFKNQWPLLNDWDEIADWFIQKYKERLDKLLFAKDCDCCKANKNMLK